MKMSNKVYDVLKWIALVGLPPVITFYGVVGVTCNIPYTQEVLTIAAAFNTMLGAWLGISNIKYNKANAVIDSVEETE